MRPRGSPASGSDDIIMMMRQVGVAATGEGVTAVPGSRVWAPPGSMARAADGSALHVHAHGRLIPGPGMGGRSVLGLQPSSLD